LNELGAPAAGVAGEQFSVARFVTNYRKLSESGREALFGSLGGGGLRATSLKADLDNLAAVLERMKAVEKGANVSKSGVSMQNFGTGVALLNPVTMGPTFATLGAMTGAGELLTNPAFVRWLARPPKTAAQMPQYM